MKDAKLTPLTTPEGLIPSMITGLFEDRAGGLWVGVFNEGLRRMIDGRMETYTTAEGLPSNVVWTIGESALQPGVIWAGTDAGLARLADGSWTNFTEEDGVLLETLSREILCADSARAL